MIDRDPGNLHKVAYEKTKQAARQAGRCTILDADKLKRCLSYNLLLGDIPVVTLEMGEPYVVNEANVEYGLAAVWSVLTHSEMVEPSENLFCYPLPPGYGSGRLLAYWDRKNTRNATPRTGPRPRYPSFPCQTRRGLKRPDCPERHHSPAS
ncbi:MAG: hypothetical protein A2V70_09325 [Planctomycetes bacterium RBG_13_63_9]|nr:MAG: hypothetical protein A2V70_09325 [Planctomycetes bacterium RBG_13_63_9]